MLPGIDIGPLRIQYYGIILMVGALAGAWLTAHEAKRRGENSEVVWDGLVWVIIGGIIGARIWHILTPPPSMVERGITTAYYLTHPLDAINIRAGGLGIPGAVIGGLLAMWWFARRRKLDILVWIDLAAPGLALGQAIGRWGNYVNQELYGLPTNLPWGIRIDPEYRIPGFNNFEVYHPVFLYESLWSLGNMGILLWMSRRYEDRLKPGDIFLTYLVIYPIGRFLIEFLRLDSSQVAGLNANQTIMLIIAIVAVATLIWRHRFQEDVTESEHPEPMVDSLDSSSSQPDIAVDSNNDLSDDVESKEDKKPETENASETSMDSGKGEITYKNKPQE